MNFVVMFAIWSTFLVSLWKLQSIKSHVNNIPMGELD